MRPLPPLPRRPPPPLRQHDRSRRGTRRRIRRVCRLADDQRLAPLARHRRGGRRDLRPVRQRGPHGARVPRPRRGRPRQSGPARSASWPRRGAPRRGTVHRRQRAQCLRGATSPDDGSDARRRPARARPPRRRSASSAWSRASTSPSRCPATPTRCATRIGEHGPRRRDGHPRHPDRGHRRSTSTGSCASMLTLRGIYGREMYETWYKMSVMLQSGLDITPGHHAPVRAPRSRGRVRRRTYRRIRQSGDGLDRVR